MRDNYGDKVTVEPDYDVVYLKVTDALSTSTENQAELTPAKARKLAKKLCAAADEVDPRPVAESSSVSKDEPLKVGDKVRISERPYWFSPGDTGSRRVAERFHGKTGAVVSVEGSDVARVELDGDAFHPNRINFACLTKGEPKAYSLTLTQEQAETLAVVLSNVGGPHGRHDYAGRDSARTHACDVRDMLANLGVDGYKLDGRPEYAFDEEAGKREPNSIYFAPRS